LESGSAPPPPSSSSPRVVVAIRSVEVTTTTTALIIITVILSSTADTRLVYCYPSTFLTFRTHLFRGNTMSVFHSSGPLSASIPLLSPFPDEQMYYGHSDPNFYTDLAHSFTGYAMPLYSPPSPTEAATVCSLQSSNSIMSSQMPMHSSYHKSMITLADSKCVFADVQPTMHSHPNHHYPQHQSDVHSLPVDTAIVASHLTSPLFCSSFTLNTPSPSASSPGAASTSLSSSSSLALNANALSNSSTSFASPIDSSLHLTPLNHLSQLSQLSANPTLQSHSHTSSLTSSSLVNYSFSGNSLNESIAFTAQSSSIASPHYSLSQSNGIHANALVSLPESADKHHNQLMSSLVDPATSSIPSSSVSNMTGSSDPLQLPGHPPKQTANKKERRRTLCINNAFSCLRDCIPNVPYDTKLSKIKTLRLATSYISYLMELLAEDDQQSNTRRRMMTCEDFKVDLQRFKGKSKSAQLETVLVLFFSLIHLIHLVLTGQHGIVDTDTSPTPFDSPPSSQCLT
jgi:hypothetical protein